MRINENEIWIKINDFPNYYISSFGRVKNINFNQTNVEKIMKLSNKNGYLNVDLCKNGVKKHSFVHRLVAIHFLSNYENKKYVNHINGIKTDNRVENLEWCTSSENAIHAFKTGLSVISEKCKKINGERNRLNGKKVHQFSLNGEYIQSFISQSEAGRLVGVFGTNIGKCIIGKYKHCGGFIWKKEL